MKALTASLALVLLIGCASSTRIPKTTRVQLAVRHTGRTVELKHSSFFGDLYDDNNKYLLSPYPFEVTSHIVDLDGNPIHPSGQEGIIPAGTRFVIRDIEFPDVSAMSKRMLTTPRYNPWVYLEALPGQEDVPTDRKYVLLLPMDMETPEQVEKALQRRLAEEDAMREWLSSLRPTVRVAISHKKAKKGMSTDQMVAALGIPMQWFTGQTEKGSAQVAWYGTKEVWLVDNTVVEVREGRPDPNRPGAAPAPESETDAAPAEASSGDEDSTEEAQPAEAPATQPAPADSDAATEDASPEGG